MCLWFNEVDLFTPRDQLSFGYVAYRLQAHFRFFMFPNCEYNSLFVLHRHTREHSSVVEWVKSLDELTGSNATLKESRGGLGLWTPYPANLSSVKLPFVRRAYLAGRWPSPSQFLSLHWLLNICFTCFLLLPSFFSFTLIPWAMLQVGRMRAKCIRLTVRIWHGARSLFMSVKCLSWLTCFMLNLLLGFLCDVLVLLDSKGWKFSSRGERERERKRKWGLMEKRERGVGVLGVLPSCAIEVTIWVIAYLRSS